MHLETEERAENRGMDKETRCKSNKIRSMLAGYFGLQRQIHGRHERGAFCNVICPPLPLSLPLSPPSSPLSSALPPAPSPLSLSPSISLSPTPPTLYLSPYIYSVSHSSLYLSPYIYSVITYSIIYVFHRCSEPARTWRRSGRTFSRSSCLICTSV